MAEIVFPLLVCLALLLLLALVLLPLILGFVDFRHGPITQIPLLSGR